jgi:D-arabinose 1-dehydrogenase-like Zn-dependent alcohol dehydrogenase
VGGVGGLGHLALQASKAVGLETLAVTGQADKKADLLALGADLVVLAGDNPGAALREAGGADLILSTTNSATQIAAAFGGLRPGGRFVNLGVPDGPLTIDSRTLMWGQRQIRGSSQDERSDLHEILTLAAAGKVKPRLELYPLARVNEARERLQAGKVRYRVVIQHAA